ncbi:MAG TPA: leucyl/phenylalanyl-tRNA--protein transferase [Candidatus Hydrogenedentes bacterium]|nr:leucyl/phenylalanyl-tRNA--protein transferase [Candidatus Hydrogenedentota bacterium]
MPIFRLTRDLAFPPPELAEEGLLAVGGDLSPERLLLAYRCGIFPWYSDGEPILWWSPNPRMVIFSEQLHVSRRLARVLRQGKFRFTADAAFAEVIRGCAKATRPRERGTWITRDMIAAYTQLHEQGYAHSVEAWHEGRLAGGIYGVSLGACFFGESMFTRVTDASKAAITTLARQCARWGISVIDCQLPNPHLRRLGGVAMPRAQFLRRLEEALEGSTRQGRWRLDDDLAVSAFTPPSGGSQFE